MLVMDILATMTIKEAAAVWDNPRADFLARWGEMFDTRLEEINREHLARYEIVRARESSQEVVQVEMRALSILLKELGLSLEKHDGEQ